MLGTPSDPIIDIVEPDGTRHRSTGIVNGVAYTLGFATANNEARAMGLTEWKLKVVGWTEARPFNFGPY